MTSKKLDVDRNRLIDELLAVLSDRCDSDNGSGYMTSREIRDAIGWSQKKTLEALYALHRKGMLDVANVERISIAGVVHKVPGYRVKDADSDKNVV